jgi:hypothetical protein
MVYSIRFAFYLSTDQTKQPRRPTGTNGRPKIEDI